MAKVDKKRKKVRSSKPAGATQNKKNRIAKKGRRSKAASQVEQTTSPNAVENTAENTAEKTVEKTVENTPENTLQPVAVQAPKKSLQELRKNLKRGPAPVTDEITLGLMSELESQMNIQVPKAQKATEQILKSIGIEGKESFISPKALAALRGNIKKKK